MPIKTITVTARGELQKSKKGRTYFIVQTEDEPPQFICYKANLYPEFPVGATQVIEYKEATSGFSPSIEGTVQESKANEELQPPEPEKPAPQELGMWWKEVGEIIRQDPEFKLLIKIFGKENAKSVVKEYRGRLLSTLKIPYDGSKLPLWKEKED